jgi:hypothetical protein
MLLTRYLFHLSLKILILLLDSDNFNVFLLQRSTKIFFALYLLVYMLLQGFIYVLKGGNFFFILLQTMNQKGNSLLHHPYILF